MAAAAAGRHSGTATTGRKGGEVTDFPLVSVVVPTRNRAVSLRELLGALAAQRYPQIEFVIVDDASSDETPDILQTWKGEGRVALRLETPGGSYAARNRGWRASRGKIVAFTDDDCLPACEWLTALVEALRDDAVIGVQGKTLAGPGTITPFTHQIQQLTGGPPYRTCNIAYHRTVLERLGGFRDDLRWYADNLFGLEARQRGPIVFAPAALVHHPPRRREWRNRKDWLARFVADAEHRRQLARLDQEPALPPGLLPVLLWILRPLVKQSWAHTRYLLRHPQRYLHSLAPMLREKTELLAALRVHYQASEEHSTLPDLPDAPLVSVVVVTRHRPHLLAGALAAVYCQTWANHEIVVVDHGPAEETRRVAEQAGARYVTAEGTLGAARQVGVNAARGQIIAFTDDDCLPASTWLATMIDTFRSAPSLWGLQGRTTAEPGSPVAHTVQISRPNSLYQTCNMAYRREALEQADGFDQRFIGWFEDTALGVRVRRRGTIGWVPEMVVIHRAVPRHPLDRAAWRRLLGDERLLAQAYPSFYWRTRGPGWLLTTIGRWLVGSPAKTLLQARKYARGNPAAYLCLVRSLFAERRALLAALADVLSEPRK
ncbi:MAG: glycosyltransferase family 2 protein [Chloroflexota bacterium]